MLGRLRLLGHDLAAAEREYHDLWVMGDQDPENAGLPFARLCEMLRRVDVKSLSPEYGEHDFGKLFRRELASRLGVVQGDGIDTWTVSQIIENFSAPSALVLRAQNPENLEIPVVWRFADVVDNGWSARADVVRSLRADEQFLVITEGSSDVAVLRRALALVRPDTQDFYRFIDASDGYQFFGTGNLFKLAQGLVTIGILNRTVVLYDNDTEGRSKLLETERLRLPSTMHAIRLPDLERLEKKCPRLARKAARWLTSTDGRLRSSAISISTLQAHHQIRTCAGRVTTSNSMPIKASLLIRSFMPNAFCR
jgi:HEPN/Toprim N-terminal domain 1